MVNKYIKTMIEFIEDAKDEKLMSFIGLGSARSAIVKDGNYRIDMQKVKLPFDISISPSIAFIC